MPDEAHEDAGRPDEDGPAPDPDDGSDVAPEAEFDAAMERAANRDASPDEEGDAAPEDDVMLACHHVSRWYGDVIAVNDVDLTIRPGITGLLGPNGAGKTTLLRMAMGLIRPSQGRVTVLGQDPWNNPGLLRRIGYVPEAPAPWRDLTGLECLRRGAYLVGLEGAAADEAAQEALAAVGLEDDADKVVAGYSHGMQQRLKFALALVNDPDVFILDEPLLGTDPLARRDLMQLMRKQADAGKSILLSTHVLSDVEVLTERIMLLDHGRLMAHGSVREIRDLLDQYPRTVRIGTPEPRALGKQLWDWPSVQTIQAEDGHLTVLTPDPATFYGELQRFLAQSKIEFTSVTSPDESVEAVFRYLVK